MPILYRNILFGLPSDFARDVFLWAVERSGEDAMCYRAEAFAREAENLVSVVRDLIFARQYSTLKAGGRLLDEDQQTDLLKFVLTRHANWRFGGNLCPGYAAFE